MKIRPLKAQQEIVGFVIIILMVVIVGVIFLGFYLKSDNKVNKDDAEIENFLSSSLKYTSECYKDYEGDYKSLRELVKYCKEGITVTCPNNMDSCQYMTKTFGWIIKRFWPAGADRPTKYTQLSFYSQANITDPGSRTSFGNSIFYGNKTGCVVLRAGEAMIDDSPGVIVVDFEVCKAG